MQNKQTGIGRIVFEIALVMLGVLLCVVSVLTDNAIIRVPNCLVMKVENNEDLLFTLFSVQAGIATVGIAIIAIITGTTTESYLGISFSEYITSIKPFMLTHKRLLITSLVLIIANYVAMSFLMTNLCIAILIVSVIIAIHLVADVYVIFRGTVGMQQDIRNYIISKYDVKRISNIKNELMCAIETNSELTVEYTTATLKEIFEIEIKKFCKKNQTVDLIVMIIAEAFQQVVKQHNPARTNKMIQLVYELYRIANRDNKHIYPLDLWEHIYRDYYTGLKDLTDEQIKEDFYYYLLHGELYTNFLSEQENLDKDSFLRMYSCWTYNALLLSQTNREPRIQNRIKKDLYDLSSCYVQLESKDLDERQERIRIQELCYLIKVAIDNGDTELLEEHFFDSYKYRDQNTKHGMVLVVALIYLYYLAAREDLKSGEKVQNNAKEILRGNQEFVSHFFYELDIIAVIKEYKSIMDTMLWNWEQMDEGEVKHVVIIDAIEDFFVFSICAETWNKNRIAQMIDIIAPDQMFSIYQRYFSADRKDRTARLFAEYCKLFAEDRYVNDSYEDRLAILEEVFNERYHQEAIKDGKESVLLKEDMDTYAEALRSKFAEFIRKDLSRFRYKSDDENTIIKQENKCDLLYMKLPNTMIREQRVHSAIIDHMIGRTMSVFFYCLSGNVDYKEVTRSTSNKQQCLIDMVEALKITPTIAIGHRDTFWGETDERALQKYTEQLEHFKFPGGYNLYYIIDGNRVGFNVTNICAEYIDVPVESILEACQKREDGKLYYNITNDIFIPFEESEIIQYVQSTHKIIRIVADISYYCSNEKIGAGIRISADKDTRT